MRVYIMILCLSFCFTGVRATNFLNISLPEAQSLAAQERKNIFIYFTTKWCGPCKAMERMVFSNDTVSNVLKQNFISIKIDGDSWAGEKLVKEFTIAGYPTLLIVNPDKSVLKRNFGGMQLKAFLEFIHVDQGELTAPVSPGANEIKGVESKNKRTSSCKPEWGIKAGVVASFLSNSFEDARVGYDFGFFAAMEKNRWLIRPGISLISKGGKNETELLRLNYIQLPVDIGLTFYKGAIAGLPGGVRVIGSPYVAYLINNNNFRRTDYGLRMGVGMYIGETSKLELLLSSEMGFTEIVNTEELQQRNYAVSAGILFTL